MKMRMNFVMGNVCDRLERVDKRGNEAGTSTQDVRKEGCKPRDHVTQTQGYQISGKPSKSGLIGV